MSKKAVNDITDALTELIREDNRPGPEPPVPQAPPKKRQVVSLFIVSVAVLLAVVVLTQIVSSQQKSIQPVNLENIPELIVEDRPTIESPLDIEEPPPIQETYTKYHFGVGCSKKTIEQLN